MTTIRVHRKARARETLTTGARKPGGIHTPGSLAGTTVGTPIHGAVVGRQRNNNPTVGDGKMVTTPARRGRERDKAVVGIIIEEAYACTLPATRSPRKQAA